MSLGPVEPVVSLTDRVFTIIHAGIMSGDLPAGTQLKVRNLADQVGTSVMPVREAIRRLEEAGLAIREPNKGTVVRALTRTELVDTYKVRLLLEVDAARTGGFAVTEHDCRVMEDLCDRLDQAVERGDTITALDTDEAILGTLYAAAGNPVLLESIRGLWQRCRAYKIRGAQRAQELGDRSLWLFQRRIVTAAGHRDGDACADVTYESLVSALDRVGMTFADD